MRTYGRKHFRRCLALGGAAAAALAAAASASTLVGLPPGTQVNDDPAAGIHPSLSVSGVDPTNADVVGGSLVAGNKAVPWAIFRQQETNGTPPPHDQIFSRSFAAGAWTTRGSGTVGGRSSSSPTFSGSLNFDQRQDGEAPAIDFAGAGRAVPWATWYEATSGTGFGGNDNVFASRFDNTGDANQGKWIFAGQSRGLGGGNVPVPSLNLHTNRSAENPSVAGGSAVDPTKPGPWVTWQETTTAPVPGKDEIFVERPIGPGTANCDGVTPAGVPDGTGHVPAIGGFCWQQTGIGRAVGGTDDPSLNVDPTRNGIEPDIAFTGSNDSVPWVVWYETGPTTVSGLHTNEMVFAAKGVSDSTADGGFHWVAVGDALTATLDRTGAHRLGTCAESAANEGQCSLNHDPAADAEDPRVAAGTMDPAVPTVPWVVWDEKVGGVSQVFVARLVGAPAPAHFKITNAGAPITNGTGDATRPDITFSGNTPYVTWRENVGGVDKGFTGHFINPTNPRFVSDNFNVPLTPTAQADVREPISSSCTANPFNADGAACQGNAIGTPFFLSTKGTSPRRLFASAYSPGTPVTGGATGITSSGATVAATVNPRGAAVNVSFQFGTTTAYGSSTTPQKTPVSNFDGTSFNATLSGLPANTTIHYRAIAQSDFGTVVGGDQTFKTTS